MNRKAKHALHSRPHRNRIKSILTTVAILILLMAIITVVWYVVKRFPKKAHTDNTTSTTVATTVPTTTTTAPKLAYKIENFTAFNQRPELPTGCEITALTMVLQHKGFSVDKVTMANTYLPRATAKFTTGADGKRYGPDMENYFVGNPTNNSGYICGTGAIVSAANKYLETTDSTLRAHAENGIDLQKLYAYIANDNPVIIWCTIGMENRWKTQGWYREDGTFMEWSQNDHGGVLIGYTETTITYADPIVGVKEIDRAQFEKVFASRGNQCVIIE